jgi:hypothetical protein
LFLFKLCQAGFQSAVFFDHLTDGGSQIFLIMKKLRYVVSKILHEIYPLFDVFSRDSLYPSYAGGDGTFGDDSENSDISGRFRVRSAAKLDGLAELHHSDPVAILFAKQRHRAHLVSLFQGNGAVVFERRISAYFFIDHPFYGAYFFGCEFREVGEVEPQAAVFHHRAFLLDVFA